MENEFILAALGGACIGLGAVILLFTAGKIAGVSGICSGIFVFDRPDKKWRIFFVAGLLCAAIIWAIVWPGRFSADNSYWLRYLVGGSLVGYGTKLANGCTSGHGVCGIARFSKRSIVATCVFLATAITVVTAVRFF